MSNGSPCASTRVRAQHYEMHNVRLYCHNIRIGICFLEDIDAAVARVVGNIGPVFVTGRVW